MVHMMREFYLKDCSKYSVYLIILLTEKQKFQNLLQVGKPGFILSNYIAYLSIYYKIMYIRIKGKYSRKNLRGN